MQARIIKDWHTVYTDPLSVHAGEGVRLGKRDDEWLGWIWATNDAGQSGWMPERLVEAQGAAGTALRDYTARELDMQVGDEVTLHELESGWYWATNAEGWSGWVPAAHVASLQLTSK